MKTPAILQTIQPESLHIEGNTITVALDTDIIALLAVWKQQGKAVDLSIAPAIKRLRDVKRRHYFALIGLFWKKLIERGADPSLTREAVDGWMRSKYASVEVNFTAGQLKIDEETGELIGAQPVKIRAPLSLSRHKGMSDEQVMLLIRGTEESYYQAFGEYPPPPERLTEIEQQVAISALYSNLD